MCNRVEVQVEVQVECSNVRGCVGVRRVLGGEMEARWNVQGSKRRKRSPVRRQ